MKTVELELTYLAKSLPEGLENYPSKTILSINIPTNADHPNLRLRQVGDQYEITRKTIADGQDSSHMIEQTIELSADEFSELAAQAGKRTRKTRYYYPCQDLTAEIDVFEDGLKGLVLVDFEFASREAQQQFVMPDFCLANVTQEAFVAGGMLAGKVYADIAPQLKRYGYKGFFAYS